MATPLLGLRVRIPPGYAFCVASCALKIKEHARTEKTKKAVRRKVQKAKKTRTKILGKDKLVFSSPKRSDRLWNSRSVLFWGHRSAASCSGGTSAQSPVMGAPERSLLFRGLRGSFPVLKRPGSEVNLLPPSSAEVKNKLMCASNSPACLYGVYRDNFLYIELYFILVYTGNLSIIKRWISNTPISLKLKNCSKERIRNLVLGNSKLR